MFDLHVKKSQPQLRIHCFL